MNNDNKSQDSLPLLTPRLFSGLTRKIREYRWPFFSTLVIGLFCYMFMFTNKLLTHDDIGNMFSKGATVSSGRWGLDILSRLLPDYSLPWFHGILTLLLLAAAVCFIVHLLSIRRPLLQVLTAGLIISFPSLIGTFGYMFTSSSYGVAFLLAVMAAWAFSHRDLRWTAGGLILLALSLSIYQAYVALTASLLVMVLIRRTMYTQDPVKKILFQGIYFVLCLGFSMILYWVLTQGIQRMMGLDMSYYVDDALGGEGGIAGKLLNTVNSFLYILLLGYKGLVHEGFVQVLHLIFCAVLAFEVIFWCCRSRKWDRICMLAFLLAVFPLTLTSVMLFTAMGSAHSLVYYGFAGLYILAAMLIEGGICAVSPKQWLNTLRTLGLDLGIVCLAVIVYCNSAIANQAYLNLHMRYENNYRMASSLITRMETTPGFTEDTPVAVIGGLPVTVDLDRTYDVNHITGVSEQATRNWDLTLFLKYYCGANYDYLNFDQCMALIDDPQFRAMDFYPGENSIAMIDGTLVLKMDPWQLPEEFAQRITAE